jgi:hypothetical protein
VDFGTTGGSPNNSGYCSNYTSGSAVNSTVVALPSGFTTSSGQNCGQVLPLACCVSPATARMRGYTTFTSTGNLGGRTTANARCSSEFPGAHFCTDTEFLLARGTMALGAAGAWVDFGTTGGAPNNSGYCSNYTSGNAANSTVVALPSGFTTSSGQNCGQVLPLACCD